MLMGLSGEFDLRLSRVVRLPNWWTSSESLKFDILTICFRRAEKFSPIYPSQVLGLLCFREDCLVQVVGAFLVTIQDPNLQSCTLVACGGSL